MRIIPVFVTLLLMAGGIASCGQEVKGLTEENRLLKEQNSFLKAENIGLKKELEELYRKLEEKSTMEGKSAVQQKPSAGEVAKTKEGLKPVSPSKKR